jgi:hypothetical protein
MGALLLFWALRLRGQALVVTDTMEYVFPEKWVGAALWRDGHVPLWNPFIACGTPHLANFQSGSLYPPFWLWNLTGLWDWFYFMVLLHVAWGVLGFFLWARDRGVLPLPAFLAGLSFGLSSQMTYLWGFPTHASTFSWVPWVFLAAARFLDKPSALRGVALSACLALQWTAGYLQIGVYTALFLLLWTAWQGPAWRTWAGLAGAAAVASAVTAAQWLPTADFLSYADRTPHLAHVYSLKAAEYLNILWPNWVGFPGAEGYKGSLPNTVFMPGYVGLGALILLAGALVSWRRSSGRFFALAAVLVLLWGAGSHLPPWRWAFGRWAGLLEPAKASFLWTFCACTAAALFLSRLSSGWRGPGGRAGMAVLAAAMMLDLYTVPARCVRHQPDPYRDPQVNSAMGQLARMTGNGRMVSLRRKEALRWSDRRGQEGFLWESAFQGFPNMNAVFGIRTAGAHLSLYLDGYQNMLLYLQKGFPYRGRILDAAGVRALVLPERLSGIKYEVGMTLGGLLFHSNAGALPGAWRVSWVREMRDRPSALVEMTRPDLFLEETVLTEDAPGGRAVMLAPPRRTLRGGARPPSTAWVRLLRFLRGEAPSREFTDQDPSPCRAVFEADFKDRGWMVFSESFAPGWRAWVDGEPKPIFRGDGLFMAVPVGRAGVHRVSFRYEPAAFRLGLFLTLATLALSIALGPMVGRRARGV